MKRAPDGWLDDYAPFTEHRFSSWLYLSRPARVAYRCVQAAAAAFAVIMIIRYSIEGWR